MWIYFNVLTMMRSVIFKGDRATQEVGDHLGGETTDFPWRKVPLLSNEINLVYLQLPEVCRIGKKAFHSTIIEQRQTRDANTLWVIYRLIVVLKYNGPNPLAWVETVSDPSHFDWTWDQGWQAHWRKLSPCRRNGSKELSKKALAGRLLCIRQSQDNYVQAQFSLSSIGWGQRNCIWKLTPRRFNKTAKTVQYDDKPL